jgi:hypothetical protein
MDWKYKYFSEEATFQAKPEIVLRALRAFAAEWLDDWKVSESPAGFEVVGLSAGHDAVAKFHLEPVGDGTKVTVEMQVESASSFGFLLLDKGSYGGMIRKWLQALPWWIDQRQPTGILPGGLSGKARPVKPPPMKPMPGAALFSGCSTITILLAILIYGVTSLVGLLTGNLLIIGNGGTSTIHGVWARILSAIVLAIFGWVVWYWRYKSLNGGPK